MVAAHGVFNFVLGNGEAVFAYCATNLAWRERSYPFSQVSLIDRDLSINLGDANRVGDRMILVATEPLTRGEPWTAFLPGELQGPGRRRRGVEPCLRTGAYGRSGASGSRRPAFG